jgi:hypothetical protein
MEEVTAAPTKTIELPIIKTTAAPGAYHKTAIDAVAIAIVKAFIATERGAECEPRELVKIIAPDYFHGGGENKRFQVTLPEPVYDAIIEKQEIQATVPQTMAKYTLGIRNYTGRTVATGKKIDSIYKAKVEMKGGTKEADIRNEEKVTNSFAEPFARAGYKIVRTGRGKTPLGVPLSFYHVNLELANPAQAAIPHLIPPNVEFEGPFGSTLSIKYGSQLLGEMGLCHKCQNFKVDPQRQQHPMCTCTTGGKKRKTGASSSDLFDLHMA